MSSSRRPALTVLFPCMLAAFFGVVLFLAVITPLAGLSPTSLLYFVTGAWALVVAVGAGVVWVSRHAAGLETMEGEEEEPPDLVPAVGK